MSETEKVNENVETVEEPNVFDEVENEVEYETLPGSKIGGVLVGAALALGGAVLYKKAIKPGVNWVKEKWNERKSKKESKTETDETKTESE